MPDRASKPGLCRWGDITTFDTSCRAQAMLGSGFLREVGRIGLGVVLRVRDESQGAGR